MKNPKDKSDAEWQAELTPEEYRVARQHGTERAFTGQYWNSKEAGNVSLYLLRRGAVQFRNQIRFRQRLAEFLDRH